MPTTATAKPCLRANCPKTCSIREKYVEPSLGQQNATATTVAVRLPSIIIIEGPLSGVGDGIIPGHFA